MFYQAKWRAAIQAALSCYQLLLPPHRLSREAELIPELFAASALLDRCANIMNRDTSLVHGEAERRNKTDVYQAKVK